VGVRSAVKSFILRNTGLTALQISSVVLTGGIAGDFKLDTAGVPATIPVGGQAALGITFSPSALGLRTTALRVLSNDPAAPSLEVALAGTGTDSAAPDIGLHSDIAPIEATNEAGAIVTYPAATATSQNGGPVTIAYSQESGTVFPIGITMVTITATDSGGNSSTSTFAVTVRDSTAPAIVPHANVIVEAIDALGSYVSYSAATASDAGTPMPAVAYSQASGTLFPLGVTTVTVSATDAAKNIGTSSFTVTVRDTTAPVIAANSNVAVHVVTAAGATVSYPPAAAIDAVTLAPAIAYSQASGTVFPPGTTTVTITATDEANNMSTRTFTVTVADLPVLAVEQPSGTRPLSAISVVA
jgi:hypothetical protein